jgi:hypothetical protein
LELFKQGQDVSKAIWAAVALTLGALAASSYFSTSEGAQNAKAGAGQQRLTPEVYERVRKGVDRLTEDEVVKLVPGAFTVKMSKVGGDEYYLIWEEVRRIEVEFSDGKVVSATGTFSDAVASETLTLASFRKIAPRMAREEVRKLVEGSTRRGRFASRTTLDAEGKEIRVCEWTQGRKIRVQIRGGKLVGGAYMDE